MAAVRWQINLMRYSPYKAKPDRFNPEFIGIADTYNQQKHSRQLSESERKTYHSSCQYENNLNQRLIKTIELKSKELKVLKAAKGRHEKELRDVLLWDMARNNSTSRNALKSWND